MAGGFAKDGAVQEQIDATIEDAVNDARRNLPTGQSRTHCEDCGSPVPEARREAIPGVRRCVDCQSKRDQHAVSRGGINRRGSKDSQLR